MTIGRRPDSDVFLDDVTVSRDHALVVRRGGDFYLDDLGLAERHVRQPPPHRVAPAGRRRRAADRQVQADVPPAVVATWTSSSRRRSVDRDRRRPAREGDDDRRRHEGAQAGVPGHLDLEDPLPRGPEAARAEAHARRLPPLLAVRRRAAAHDPAAAARRVPAAAGHPPGARVRPRRRARRAACRASSAAAAAARARRPSVSVRDGRARSTRSRTCSRRRAPTPSLVSELEEYGVIKGENRAGTKYYDETEREIVRAVTELARYGVGGRNLRVFRTSRRPRGAAAADDPRPGAALAEPRAAQGGDRGAREPRRRRDAPQAPAADPGPAQGRRVSATSRPVHPRHPRLPEAGDRLQGHHAADGRRRGARRARSARWPSSRGRSAIDVVIGAEARGFLLGPALARELGAGLRARPQAGQAAARDGQRRVRARVRDRRARAALRRGRRTARACSSTTTCWPPAGRRGRCASSSSSVGGDGRRPARS